jgi:hypothetical protein
LIGVSEIAYNTLTLILQKSFFTRKSDYDGLAQRPKSDRIELADTIRAYWLAHRGQSLPERFYQTLADNSASTADWLDAAYHLVQPWKVDDKHTLFGDSLRDSKSPSITELMIERHDAIIKSAANVPRKDIVDTLNDAASMTRYLSLWDSEAALPVLREQFKEYQILTPAEQADNYTYHECIALTQERLACGDATAMEDLVPTLVNAKMQNGSDSNLRSVLSVLWQKQNDPDMIADAQTLFNNPQSALYDLSKYRCLLDLISSPLLKLPAFRSAVLRGLSDGAITAMGDIDQLNYMQIIYSDGNSGLDVGSDAPPVGTTFPIRHCDMIADALRTSEGMQAFELYWPVRRRNATIEKGQRNIARH